MTALEQFHAGKLQEAIDEAINAVKANPTGLAMRFELIELFCLAGDLDRADIHLNTITKQELKPNLFTLIYRQLLRAEKSRREFFQQGRLPEFVDEPGESIRLRLAASIDYREGNLAEAFQKILQADELRTPVAGSCDQKPFADIRDGDDLTAEVLEVLTTNGKYYWIPFESIEQIDVQPLERMIDVLWRKVRIDMKNGPDGEFYVPAIYPLTYEQDNNELLLGRAVDWIGEENEPLRGLGNKMIQCGSDFIPFLEVKQLKFGPLDS